MRAGLVAGLACLLLGSSNVAAAQVSAPIPPATTPSATTALAPTTPTTPTTPAPPALMQPAGSLTMDQFFGDQTIGAAELSPSGRYLALGMHMQGKEALIVRDLQTEALEVVAAYPEDAGIDIDWIEWKGEGRLLYAITMYTERRRGGKEDGLLLAFNYGRAVFAADRNGANSVMLFNQEKGIIRRAYDLAGMLDSLRADPDHVLMLAPAPNYGTSVYKVDVHSGTADLVEKGTANTVGWNTDKDGAVVARIDAIAGGRGAALLAREPDGGWSEVLRIRPKDLREAPDFEIIGPTETPGRLYVLVEPKDDEGGETTAIRTYDFKTRTIGDVVWRHPKYDTVGAVIDHKTSKLVAACYVADVYQCDFFDKELNANFKALAKFFNNERSLHALSVSEDGGLWLLDVRGAQDRGTLYKFDWRKKSIDPIGVRWPQLPLAKLGPMSVFSYKARDGADLSAYLTVPPQAGGAPAPLIVMPHGGPEARDALAFDIWGQYFATRGYAVLQPNFRGSGGFGRTFAESGYRQWGARMQDDVTDGVTALIASGKVDPARVCIVGASYGGYAALYGGAAQPDLYKCVVSVAGISDLTQFVKWQKREGGSDSDRYKYWVKSVGEPETDGARLAEKSAITYAASYKPPVLLAHGGADDIVPVEQSRIMEKALKKAGADVKLIVFDNEEHSYWSDAHEKQLLGEMEAFVNAHIGAPH